MRTFLTVLWVLSAAVAYAKEAVTVAVIEGDPLYKVLEVGEIPAIDDPAFFTGRAADLQMKGNEPVLGIVLAGEAHAYSLWQLDAHEIVNDRLAGAAIAATW